MGLIKWINQQLKQSEELNKAPDAEAYKKTLEEHTRREMLKEEQRLNKKHEVEKLKERINQLKIEKDRLKARLSQYKRKYGEIDDSKD